MSPIFNFPKTPTAPYPADGADLPEGLHGVIDLMRDARADLVKPLALLGRKGRKRHARYVNRAAEFLLIAEGAIVRHYGGGGGTFYTDPRYEQIGPNAVKAVREFLAGKTEGLLLDTGDGDGMRKFERCVRNFTIAGTNGATLRVECAVDSQGRIVMPDAPRVERPAEPAPPPPGSGSLHDPRAAGWKELIDDAIPGAEAMYGFMQCRLREMIRPEVLSGFNWLGPMHGPPDLPTTLREDSGGDRIEVRKVGRSPERDAARVTLRAMTLQFWDLPPAKRAEVDYSRVRRGIRASWDEWGRAMTFWWGVFRHAGLPEISRPDPARRHDREMYAGGLAARVYPDQYGFLWLYPAGPYPPTFWHGDPFYACDEWDGPYGDRTEAHEGLCRLADITNRTWGLAHR